ncbi:MAG: hypothetical protein IKZ19_00765, partial [Clostridia bacterium]|nr:hypothetical protein [Clostridia bacterium]
MALIMVFSLVPGSVFATDAPAEEVHDHDHDHDHQDEVTEVTETDEETPSDAYLAAQFAVDNMLTKYLGTTETDEKSVYVEVAKLDIDELRIAQVEIYELAEDSEGPFAALSEEELALLLEANPTAVCFAEAVDGRLAALNLLVEAIGNPTTVIDGVQISGKSNHPDGHKDNTVNVENGTVTITATGYTTGEGCNTENETTTVTVTITNSTVSAKILSFDYSGDGYTISNLDSSWSTGKFGPYTISSGGSVTVTVTSGAGAENSGKTTTLKNFSLEDVPDSVDLIINYDSSLGSVTVDGAVVTGQTNAVSVGTHTLTATVAEGATFVGWTDQNGNVLSSNATCSVTVAAETTVGAIFAVTGSSDEFGAFLVGSTYYSDFNAAAVAAAVAKTKMVLVKDYTLPAGDYFIPKNATLLIPFDDAHTLYTTKPGLADKYATPNAYRTLTMADGAKLIVNGAMSLSNKFKSAAGSKYDGGAPSGPCSYVKMQGNSS